MRMSFNFLICILLNSSKGTPSIFLIFIFSNHPDIFFYILLLSFLELILFPCSFYMKFIPYKLLVYMKFSIQIYMFFSYNLHYMKSYLNFFFLLCLFLLSHFSQISPLLPIGLNIAPHLLHGLENMCPVPLCIGILFFLLSHLLF